MQQINFKSLLSRPTTGILQLAELLRLPQEAGHNGLQSIILSGTTGAGFAEAGGIADQPTNSRPERDASSRAPQLRRGRAAGLGGFPPAVSLRRTTRRSASPLLLQLPGTHGPHPRHRLRK